MSILIPHQLTHNVKLLQKAALWHDDKVLIVKRAAESCTRPNQWDLPGGNSEWPSAENQVKLRQPFGNDAATGNFRDLHKSDLVREIFEETGIELRPEVVQENVYVGTYFEVKKEIYSIVLGWKIELSSMNGAENFAENSVLLSEEHSDYAWVKVNELEDYDFGFAGGIDGFIRRVLLQ